MRLRTHQQQLHQECVDGFALIFEREKDSSRGEFFPSVWYSTDAEVTAMQYFELARAILLAEDPNLESVHFSFVLCSLGSVNLSYR